MNYNWKLFFHSGIDGSLIFKCDFFNFCFKFGKVYTNVTYTYKLNSQMTWPQLAKVIINIDIAM